jgi:superfamily II DNA or RNA helicase
MGFRELVQKEAVETALANTKGTLDLSVRLGKTKIGLDIAKEFKSVLVAYPNNSIKNSWVEDSLKFDIDITHIDFTTFRSLEKQNLSLYDCIIVDESHDLAQNNFLFLLQNRINRIYSLTGTPPVKGEKKFLMDKLFPIIYSKKLDETTGKTNKDYRIIVHLLEPNTENNILLKSGKKWSEFAQINFWEKLYKDSPNFNNMLRIIHSIAYSKTKFEYAKKLAKELNRCLIFLETKKQCDELKYPSYYSGNKKSDENLSDFQSTKINKLSTLMQLKAGITFTNLDKMILLHTYSNNARSAQKIGRCLNFAEGVVAEINIICLKGTRDEDWVKNALKEYDQTKITWQNKK